MQEMQYRMHQSLNNKDKRAQFICVCFSGRDHKRYEGGDSNRTIYFERPNGIFLKDI